MKYKTQKKTCENEYRQVTGSGAAGSVCVAVAERGHTRGAPVFWEARNFQGVDALGVT